MARRKFLDALADIRQRLHLARGVSGAVGAPADVERTDADVVAREKKPALVKNEGTPEEKSVVKKTLGLDLSNLTNDLRKRYKIKDSVKGAVITAVEDGSAAAEKRLAPGEIIVEVAQEPVSSAADVQKKVDQLKKDGRKSALLLIANAEGEVRFVALSLQ